MIARLGLRPPVVRPDLDPLDLARLAVCRQVTRRRAKNATAGTEVASPEARIGQRADSHYHIEALFDHVDKAVGELDFDLEGFIGPGECGDGPREMGSAEVHWGADSKQAPGLVTQLGHG